MKNSGADALVLFNRFYQPDFDINELVLKTDLNYSEPSESPVAYTHLDVYKRQPIMS